MKTSQRMRMKAIRMFVERIEKDILDGDDRIDQDVQDDLVKAMLRPKAKDEDIERVAEMSIDAIGDAKKVILKALRRAGRPHRATSTWKCSEPGCGRKVKNHTFAAMKDVGNPICEDHPDQEMDLVAVVVDGEKLP